MRSQETPGLALDPWGGNLSEYITAAVRATSPSQRYRMACTILEWHRGAGSHPNTIRAWQRRARKALQEAYPE